jgi:flagellin
MLPIENNTFSSLNSAYILDGVYAGLGIKINNTAAGIFLNNADVYTGKSSISESLRIFLNENASKTETVNSGIEMVQLNQDYLGQIKDKVTQMSELADQAAAGGLTPAELSDLQDQFTTLSLEMDTLAQTELGKTSLLKEDGQETVAVSTALSIRIDKQDMTTSGLELDSTNLITDAQGAVDDISQAISRIDSFSTHLDTKLDTLEASSAVLDVQRTSLQAAKAAVESTNSALMVVGMLSGMAQSHAGLFMAAQAHLTTETVMGLLSD